MKFQTVILSALLLVSSSAAQVAQPAGANAPQAIAPTGNKQELISQILNKIKAKLDTYDAKKLTQVANRPARGPKGPKAPAAAPQQPPKAKRNILKTVVGIGKGLLGL